MSYQLMDWMLNYWLLAFKRLRTIHVLKTHDQMHNSVLSKVMAIVVIELSLFVAKKHH